MVLRDDDVALVAERLERLADVARPQIAVAHLGAADGVEVVHGVRHVLGHVEHAELREVHQHFRRRLGARHELEHDLDAVDGARVAWSCRSSPVGAIRRDRAARQPSCPGRCRPGRAGPAAATTPNWYCARRLIAVPAIMFSRHGRFHEAGRREHLDLAGRHVGLADHALDAAEMVGVAVRIDHGADRLLRPVLVVQLQRGARRLGGEQRVDDDQRGVAFDDRHVGDVEAAHLVDAVGHLEQAVDRVELRLAPQARVDAVGGVVLLQEIVGLHVPDRARSGAGHQRIGHGADEAAHRVVEILAVGERQRLRHLGVGLQRCGLGRLGRDLAVRRGRNQRDRARERGDYRKRDACIRAFSTCDS